LFVVEHHSASFEELEDLIERVFEDVCVSRVYRST